MASEKGIDLLMKFKTLEGDYVAAESTDSLGDGGSDGLSVSSSGLSLRFDSRTAEKDPLLAGFETNYVFEVFNFSFGTGVQFGDEDEHAGLGGLLANYKPGGGQDSKGLKDLVASLKKGKPSSKGKNWKFGEDGSVQLQPVSFSRLIDQASSTLLQRCFDSKYFEKITLVKRRATGGAASGYGYLRMDFGGAMITQINWTDDDEVKEQVTFVCRSVQLQYRPMLPSGKLGAVVPGSWKMAAVTFPPDD